MPIIYATKELEDIHTRLVAENPTADIILVCNGPLAYAWNTSARRICKAFGWWPKKHITIKRKSIDQVVRYWNKQG